MTSSSIAATECPRFPSRLSPDSAGLVPGSLGLVPPTLLAPHTDTGIITKSPNFTCARAVRTSQQGTLILPLERVTPSPLCWMNSPIYILFGLFQEMDRQSVRLLKC